MTANGRVRFTGELRSMRGGGHAIEVDPELMASIGAKSRRRVRGSIAGTPYRSNLVSMGGTLLLGVHKATVKAAGSSIGDALDVTMSLDTEPLPEDTIPDILEDALRRSTPARAAWDRMPPSHRREYVRHILEAKKDETRARRVEAAIDAMLEWGNSRR
jgi:Bacteriocin-protection, YdeI or OmpD-Associated/Domain of unknown function (DUF1905)